ncbi:uncharacterized protein G2W53_022231 [Senna tora]|uniref:Uncharacterized protein n=1 Tax=Senna tora TaxID=362788 RepID=A0A834TMB7_9FABA|nr:uncharacterized protein G2W53_022231 [Senna tora]
MSDKEYEAAHLHVLLNYEEVEPYLESLVDDQHALEVAYQSEEAYNVIPIDDGVLYVDLGDISQIAEEIEQVHEDENNPGQEDIEEDSDDGAKYDEDEDIESQNEDNNEI